MPTNASTPATTSRPSARNSSVVAEEESTRSPASSRTPRGRTSSTCEATDPISTATTPICGPLSAATTSSRAPIA
ncbi:MAG: hypothetical protein ITG02_14920 [Patulibacter sp.]|nr:hypothetical protein [Patulibacter sp.]